MARKFFYVCAGMLMLALAYHLGATQANAQLGSITAVGIEQGRVAMAVGRTVYGFEAPPNSPPGSGQLVGVLGGVPRVSPIVGCAYTQGTMWAVLENGDVYWACVLGCTPQGWIYSGNALGGSPPVPTASESWGQLKSRYAPNKGQAQPGTIDR